MTKNRKSPNHPSDEETLQQLPHYPSDEEDREISPEVPVDGQEVGQETVIDPEESVHSSSLSQSGSRSESDTYVDSQTSHSASGISGNAPSIGGLRLVLQVILYKDMLLKHHKE